MSFQSVGTAESQEIAFNSGVITVGTKKLVDVMSVAKNEALSEQAFFALNSIKKRAIRRSNYEVTLTMTVRSASDTLLGYYYSSSSVVSGTEKVYTMKDGQQDAIDPWLLTLYTNAAETAGFQYELQNPTILSHNLTASTQEYSEWEVEVACTDLVGVRRITV
jgi:hypothetical protein